MPVGIEDMNAYLGRASLDVAALFRERGLDESRLGNLQMVRKSVNLPLEDPVTNAVNAARPLLAGLTRDDLARIEAVIVGSESGLDFGKPLSTYVHEHLGLGRAVRSFEVKHACYGGTAALRTAEGLLASAPAGAKALVIATDAASAAARDTYWEPSQGAGAVAMLVGDRPAVLELDSGAYGLYSHQVMDTLRPAPDIEAGSTDLSLLSYLECLHKSWLGYAAKVEGADLVSTFQRLVLHTPFAGMVKGGHRQLLRRHTALSSDQIEADFRRRTEPSLKYCSQAGNVYSAAVYLALCSLIDGVQPQRDERIGVFSYGSGCASEFYSGVVPAGAAQVLARHGLPEQLGDRYPLSMEEYEVLSDLAPQRMCGGRDMTFDVSPYERIYKEGFADRELLVLDGIEDYHRRYRWS
jgi:polyketide biosynthesis 3-hydroxy-3-methylglutaryl-CoA synthase-like enzyme PksG